MNVFTMVFGIVVVSLVAGVIQTYLKQKTKGAGSAEVLRRLDALESLIKDKLEPRIANLETIVTDPEFDLKQKINQL